MADPVDTNITLQQSSGTPIVVPVKDISGADAEKLYQGLAALPDDHSGINYQQRADTLAKALVGITSIANVKLPDGIKLNEATNVVEAAIQKYGAAFRQHLPVNLMGFASQFVPDATNTVEGIKHDWNIAKEFMHGYTALSSAEWNAVKATASTLGLTWDKLDSAITPDQARHLAAVYVAGDIQFHQTHKDRDPGLLDKAEAAGGNWWDKLLHNVFPPALVAIFSMWKNWWDSGFTKPLAQCFHEAYADMQKFQKDPLKEVSNDERARQNIAHETDTESHSTAADILAAAGKVDGYSTDKLAQMMKNQGGIVADANGDESTLDLSNVDSPDKKDYKPDGIHRKNIKDDASAGWSNVLSHLTPTSWTSVLGTVVSFTFPWVPGRYLNRVTGEKEWGLRAPSRILVERNIWAGRKLWRGGELTVHGVVATARFIPTIPARTGARVLELYAHGIGIRELRIGGVGTSKWSRYAKLQAEHAALIERREVLKERQEEIIGKEGKKGKRKGGELKKARQALEELGSFRERIGSDEAKAKRQLEIELKGKHGRGGIQGELKALDKKLGDRRLKRTAFIKTSQGITNKLDKAKARFEYHQNWAEEMQARVERIRTGTALPTDAAPKKWLLQEARADRILGKNAKAERLLDRASLMRKVGLVEGFTTPSDAILSRKEPVNADATTAHISPDTTPTPPAAPAAAEPVPAMAEPAHGANNADLWNSDVREVAQKTATGRKMGFVDNTGSALSGKPTPAADSSNLNSGRLNDNAPAPLPHANDLENPLHLDASEPTGGESASLREGAVGDHISTPTHELELGRTQPLEFQGNLALKPAAYESSMDDALMGDRAAAERTTLRTERKMGSVDAAGNVHYQDGSARSAAEHTTAHTPAKPLAATGETGSGDTSSSSTRPADGAHSPASNAGAEKPTVTRDGVAHVVVANDHDAEVAARTQDSHVKGSSMQPADAHIRRDNNPAAPANDHAQTAQQNQQGNNAQTQQPNAQNKTAQSNQQNTAEPNTTEPAPKTAQPNTQAPTPTPAPEVKAPETHVPEATPELGHMGKVGLVGAAGAPFIGGALQAGLVWLNEGTATEAASQAGDAIMDGFLPNVSKALRNGVGEFVKTDAHRNTLDNVMDYISAGAQTVAIGSAGLAVGTSWTGVGGIAFGTIAAVSEGVSVGTQLLKDGTTYVGLTKGSGLIGGIAGLGEAAVQSKKSEHVESWWGSHAPTWLGGDSAAAAGATNPSQQAQQTHQQEARDIDGAIRTLSNHGALNMHDVTHLSEIQRNIFIDFEKLKAMQPTDQAGVTQLNAELTNLIKMEDKMVQVEKTVAATDPGLAQAITQVYNQTRRDLKGMTANSVQLGALIPSDAPQDQPKSKVAMVAFRPVAHA